jgi:hypothetical protein
MSGDKKFEITVAPREIKAVLVRGPFTVEEFERVVNFVKAIDDARADPAAIFEIMSLGGSGTVVDQILKDLDEKTLSAWRL